MLVSGYYPAEQKYHKCVFSTELIFCNIPKSNGKIPLIYIEVALVMLTPGLTDKNTSCLNQSNAVEYILQHCLITVSQNNPNAAAEGEPDSAGE